MRIIAGTLKHRLVPAPPGNGTRPTSDRGRESLFHVLTQHLVFDEISVLDLYAGSGALAFESISRGASHATLVDASADVCRHLRTTAIALGISDQIRIVRAEALAYLRLGNPEQTDLVFADPPYALKSCNAVLQQLVQQQVLGPGSIAALEHGDQEHILHDQNLELLKQLEIGTTMFTTYRRVSPLP